MKKTKYILTILMVSMLALGFQSCDDDDEYWVKGGLDMNMTADNVYLGDGEYGFWIDYDIYNTDIWGVDHRRESIRRIEIVDAYVDIYGDFIRGDKIEFILEADGIRGSSYMLTVSSVDERNGFVTVDVYDPVYEDFIYDLAYRVANSAVTRLYVTGYTNFSDYIPVKVEFRNKFDILVRR